MAKTWGWFVIFIFLTNVAIADKVLELHFDEGAGESARWCAGLIPL